MTRNEFIYELSINLDMEYITSLVMKKQDESISGRALHHRMVNDDHYMMSIQDRYPLLSNVYNIYPLPPRCEIPLHIDSSRGCAFNIPIQGTEGTHTVFYKEDGPLKLEYDEKRIYNLVKSPVIEVFRSTLTKPLLINNTVPHKVTNNKNTMRLTLSWSLNPDVTFQQAIECFNAPVL
jgi:hypothetical protein